MEKLSIRRSEGAWNNCSLLTCSKSKEQATMGSSFIHKTLCWIFLSLDFYLRKTGVELENRKRRNVYLHVVGVNELVLGAPWVVGEVASWEESAWMGSSHPQVESGIVECFSVRSGGRTTIMLFDSLSTWGLLFLAPRFYKWMSFYKKQGNRRNRASSIQ